MTFVPDANKPVRSEQIGGGSEVPHPEDVPTQQPPVAGGFRPLGFPSPRPRSDKEQDRSWDVT